MKFSLLSGLATLAYEQGATEPDALVRDLVLLVDGASITASIQGDSRIVADARSAAAKVLASSDDAKQTPRR